MIGGRRENTLMGVRAFYTEQISGLLAGFYTTTTTTRVWQDV